MKFRVQNLLLLLICFLYFPLRGRAKSTPKKVQKVLIAQMAKLGDMVCTTPVFSAIKEKYPQAQVYVLGNKINKDLLAHNPHVDQYIIYSNNVFETIRFLRKEEIDTAFTLGPGLLSLAILYLSGITSIWAPIVSNGFSPYETKPYKLLRKLTNTYKYPMSTYVPGVFLKALKDIGIESTNTAKVLGFSPEAKNFIVNMFKEHQVNSGQDLVVGIAPSVGNKVRLWKMEYFAELIAHLQKKPHIKIFILGSKADKEPIDSLMTLISNKQNVINTMGFFNLDQLKAIVSTLDLFISVETGLTFIAESFDIPLVDITGPVDDKENSPRGPLAQIVHAPRTSAAIHVLNSGTFDHIEARRQIVDIPVDDVILATERVLQQQHT